MTTQKLSATSFAQFLLARVAAHDGYIMGATGQDPKNWSEKSWWFTQYRGSQRRQALAWREKARRVWDCNGLAEGYYKDQTGVSINTRARYNYSGWCNPKGKGIIPASMRVPGAAVFKANGLGVIHHVGYLVQPVVPGKPAGDWYIVEAKGVAYGVIRTKLSDGGWNRWGHMTKYFEYKPVVEVPVTPPVVVPSDPMKAVYKVRGIIPDVSQNQGAIADFDAFCNGTDFAIFRVVRGNGLIDTQAARNMKNCVARAYPFGAYIFFNSRTEAAARSEVRKLYNTASPYKPRFYVLDIEKWLPEKAVLAAVDELRKLNVPMVGVYMGEWRWRTRYRKMLERLVDFRWIANYGKNNGAVSKIPVVPHDLHQYTSVGRIPGIKDKTCDLNRLGQKPLSFFTGRKYEGGET